jgi:hypothetical protein
METCVTICVNGVVSSTTLIAGLMVSKSKYTFFFFRRPNLLLVSFIRKQPPSKYLYNDGFNWSLNHSDHLFSEFIRFSILVLFSKKA